MKKGSEISIVDEETLSDSYPASWSVLVDCGYQDTKSDVPAAHPIKWVPGARLANQERTDDTKVSSNIVIVKRYSRREVTI